MYNRDFEISEELFEEYCQEHEGEELREVSFRMNSLLEYKPVYTPTSISDFAHHRKFGK